MTPSPRIRILLALSVLVVLAVLAAPSIGAGPKKPITIQGEILDMGCYVSRALHKDIHRECATKCLMSGVPMGLLASDSTVYYLTPNHDRAMDPHSYDTPDPFELCRRSPARIVAVTGLLWERKGYKELEVKAAQLVSVPPSSTP